MSLLFKSLLVKLMDQKQRSDEDKLDDNIAQIREQDAQKKTINPFQNGDNIKRYISFNQCLLRVLNLCFASFYFGYTMAYLGTFKFSSIANLYDIQRDQNTVQGLLQGVTSIGGGLGALGTSIVLKNFTRRNSVLLINSIAFIVGLLILYPNLYIIFIGRFLQGICVGLYSAIIPLLIKQYSPNEISGTFGALHQTFVGFGVFFSFVFQLILKQMYDEITHWRWVFGLTIITVVLQTILLFFVYTQETPKYLLLNSQQNECEQYLKQMYKPQFVRQVLKQKKLDLGLIQNNKNENEGDKKLQHMQIQQPNSQKIQYGKKLRIVTAIHLAVLQQFVGINAVIAYGVDIVGQVLPTLASIIPVILNLQCLIASFVTSIILTKVGRKVILQIGTLLATITLVMVALGFSLKDSSSIISNFLIIVGLLIYMGSYGLSLGPVVWLYIPQVVQPQIIPFSTLSNWAGASLVIITFPILSQFFGTPVPIFFFFALWSLVALVVNKKIIVQTKGKTQKQIRDQYSQK